MSTRYQPLRQKDEFRLLTLEPDENDGTVICKLKIARIHSNPDELKYDHFDALSYVWGPSHAHSEIFLDGWKVAIRQNLWHFLKQYRRKHVSTTLWIDAVCIDQSNLSERSSQVQQMGRIYRNARRVLCWLGKADLESAVAMRFIRDGSRWNQRLYTGQEEYDYQALLTWSRRSYWTRTWIVQEFLLARDLVLICGNISLEWHTLFSFYKKVEFETNSQVKNQGEDWAEFLRSPAALLIRQRFQGFAGGTSLSRLIINNQDTSCLDPRDKIYAMLGLAKDCTPGRTLDVSYSKDVRKLLVDVIRFCRISPEDVFRYARFLAKLLHIDENDHYTFSTADTAPNSPVLSDTLRLRGFMTGSVTAVESVKSLCDLDVATLNTGGQSLLLASFLPRVGLDVLGSMLTNLQQLDSSSLAVPHDILRTASQRSWSDLQTAQLMNIETSRPPLQAALICFITSGCTQTDFYLGAAGGRIAKGDTVVQFPGCETALITTPITHSSPPQIVGRAVFASPTPGNEDYLTLMPLTFHVLRSEAECRDSRRALHLSLSIKEFLTLLK